MAKTDKLFLLGVVYEYAPGKNEARSGQQCFLLCDLADPQECPGFVWSNDDGDLEGKGNDCSFYDPTADYIEIPLNTIVSGFRTDPWGGPVIPNNV